jgi:hypothetical protein
MKILRMFGLVCFAVAFCQAAWAQCPSAIGQWKTIDGTMIGGRATEAWCGVGGNPVRGGQTGNTQTAMSWDGVSLGTQWRAWGMAIDANGAVLLTDTVDPVSGDGIRTYGTNYTGGEFWLTRDHTWSDGVEDPSGVLTSFNVVATLTIRGGVVVGASSNITFTGNFVGCPGANGCEIRFGITNALMAWSPDFGGVMPADYPALACAAGMGEAFSVCCITLDIYCAVATAEVVWGSVKAMYQ